MSFYRGLAGWLMGLAFLASAPVAHAETDTATAESLVRDSGIWQQLASISPQVRAGLLDAISRSGSRPSATEIERLSRVIDEAYASDRLRAIAVSTVKAQVQDGHVPSLQRWYASELGRRIARLDEAASAEQTDPASVFQQGLALVAAMPEARRTLLGDMVVVTRSAETLAEITIDTALAAHRGAASMAPDAPGVSSAELRQHLESQRPQMLRAYTGLALASYAKAYASLPTAELDRYLEFLKSDAGRHFTNVGMKAFSAALVEASAEMGRKLQGTRDSANT